MSNRKPHETHRRPRQGRRFESSVPARYRRGLYTSGKRLPRSLHVFDERSSRRGVTVAAWMQLRAWNEALRPVVSLLTV